MTDNNPEKDWSSNEKSVYESQVEKVEEHKIKTKPKGFLQRLLNKPKRNKDWFCRHPTCNQRFYTKEEMLKHYYPTHEGEPYPPKENEIIVKPSKEEEIDKETVKREYAIYKKRLLRGESEESARGDLKYIK